MELCALTYLVSLVHPMQSSATLQPIQRIFMIIRPIETKVSNPLINNYYIYMQLM